MKSKKFINGLNNGGITIVAIYSLLCIILYLIDYILSGKNVINSFSDISGTLVIYSIIAIVILIILTAGLYGSSNDIIEGKPISFSTFLQNGKKYFLGTLWYTLLYGLALSLVIGILLMILSYFASFSNSPFNNLPFNNISVVFNILVIFIFQAIFIPLIILDVIDKDTKDYIKNNYVTILIFSLIACSLYLIPIVGQFFYLILNGFYPLLIISMYDKVKTTENNKITMQDINNND